MASLRYKLMNLGRREFLVLQSRRTAMQRFQKSFQRKTSVNLGRIEGPPVLSMLSSSREAMETKIEVSEFTVSIAPHRVTRRESTFGFSQRHGGYKSIWASEPLYRYSVEQGDEADSVLSMSCRLHHVTCSS